MLFKNSIDSSIKQGEDGFYVGECIEIPVVTQGISIEKTISNLIEAVELYFENEIPSELGFTNDFKLIINF